MPRSHSEPTTAVVDGVEYVLVAPLEYAVSQTHRRQVGALQMSLALARAEVAELPRQLEQARDTRERS